MALSRKEAKVCDLVTLFQRAEGGGFSGQWSKTNRFWMSLGWSNAGVGPGLMFRTNGITVDSINDSLSMVLKGESRGEN